MPENYLSAGEHLRNLADLPGMYEVLEEHGEFRIVQIAPPYFQGSEFWVVNEKGFFWEPADSLQAARDYIASEVR